MKKIFVVASLVLAGAQSLCAANEEVDSLKAEQLQEVVVKGVRANENAPFAVTNVNRSQLNDFSKTGQELPFLFARTPGVIAWSENGVGTGTSYMRIRGAGDSRINVTLDGVPLNSPEDQCVFWANMNSYSSLLGSVQIQRGVGTSSNGDGAFGGTISLSSKTPSLSPMAEVTGSYGSYNTWRTGATFSTGLIGEHFIFDGAYHETNTDGYIHGTSGRSGSYYGGLTWLSDNFTIRYKNIGNFEKTGQAWNGVIAGDYDGNVLWDDNGVPALAGYSYKDLYKHGYGKWNSLVENIQYDYNGGLTSEPYVLNNGKVWDRTTDNFWQNHNILSAAWNINEKLSTTASLHYTHGYGYYEEFKYNNKFAKYGLTNFIKSDETTLKKTDFVRQKGLKQDAYGLVWNINYTSESYDLIGGINLQQFKGNHFGYLTYMKDEEAAAYYLKNGKLKYYDSDATKNDLSAYIKAVDHVCASFDIFADLQYRFVGYKTDGYNDKYYGADQKHMLDIDKKYNFFNPKFGFMYHNNGHKVYGSLALSHREPERNNFTDNGSYGAPKAEQLLDTELGYEYKTSTWFAGVNLYYMNYKNQFVQTGELSDIGEALTTNIAKSYRLGAEIVAGTKITSWLDTEANLALSANKVKDFTEKVSGYDADWNETVYENHYDNTTLAYSPGIIANWFLNAHYKGFRATWHTGYVGKMYLDNSESDARSLPAYCVSNLSANYTLNIGKAIKQIVIGANVNNIFNHHYAANGFVWYQYYNTEGERLSHNSYIPAAGCTFMTNLTLRF